VPYKFLYKKILKLQSFSLIRRICYPSDRSWLATNGASPGLVWSERMPGDPPEVVEIWFAGSVAASARSQASPGTKTACIIATSNRHLILSTSSLTK
jgi:hypothetical protein